MRAIHESKWSVHRSCACFWQPELIANFSPVRITTPTVESSLASVKQRDISVTAGKPSVRCHLAASFI